MNNKILLLIAMLLYMTYTFVEVFSVMIQLIVLQCNFCIYVFFYLFIRQALYLKYSNQFNYLQILFDPDLVHKYHEYHTHMLHVSARAYVNNMNNHQHFQCWFLVTSQLFTVYIQAGHITTVQWESESIQKCMSVFTFAQSANIIPALLLTYKEEREEARTTCKAVRTCMMKAATQRKCHIKCS